jgi:predicted nucleotidyltransferase
MTRHGLSVPDSALRDFCRLNGIRRLALFGSVLTPAFRPDSDVDVLVDFEPGCRVGMLTLSRLERELSTLFGRAIDLRTPSELSRYFRDEVLRAAEVCYAQG